MPPVRDLAQTILDLLGGLTRGQVHVGERETSGDGCLGPGRCRRLPEDEGLGWVQDDVDAVTPEGAQLLRGLVVRPSADGRDQPDGDLRRTGGLHPGDGEAGLLEGRGDVVRDRAIAPRLDDQGDVLVLQAVSGRADLAHQAGHREEQDGAGEDRGERVATDHLPERGDEAGSPVRREGDAHRQPDDRRQPERDDDERQAQPVDRDEAGPWHRGDEHPSQGREDDGEQRDDPDQRPEGDQRQGRLLGLRGASVEQGDRPADRRGRDVAEEAVHHRDNSAQQRHAATSARGRLAVRSRLASGIDSVTGPVSDFTGWWSSKVASRPWNLRAPR